MKSIPIFLTLLFCGLAPSVFAQSEGDFDRQQTVYDMALDNGDLNVAIHAIYQMLAINPERTDLNDSLTMIYFIQGAYPQAIRLGQKIIEDQPKNLRLTEVVAISQKSMGRVKDALETYEDLYKATGELTFLYEVATMQYTLKRYGECVVSLDNIIGSEKSAESQINLRVGENQDQDVPLRAACLNMKGIIGLELNQPNAAIENFNLALEVMPDFLLAKGNLAQAQEMLSEAEGGE